MPRRCRMSWEGEPHYRWVKMRNGIRYRITCSQLGLPRELWTKADSYEKANEWWESQIKVVPARTEIDRRIEWAKQHAEEELEELQQAKRSGKTDEDMTEFVVNLLRESGATIEDLDVVDPLIIREVFGNARIWQDRYAREATVPKNQSLDASIKEFLSVVSKQQRPKTYAEMKAFLDSLQDFPGLHGKMDVKNVDEDRVAKVYAALADADLTQATKKKRWGFFKRLVKFLFEMGRTSLPRNLNSKVFVFKTQARAVKTWPLAEVREAIKGLPERLGLFALLGLNCGMTNADIGQLRQNQVQKGYLTRKRVKTSHNENVPVVKYRLWLETQRLLDKFRSQGELFFLSKEGTPLWDNRIEDGEAKCKDLIALAWKRHGKCPIRLKEFRSISATMLESHKEYGRYVSYFLGHSPKTLKDMHYAAPSQDIFDEAMDWLGKQYGYC